MSSQKSISVAPNPITPLSSSANASGQATHTPEQLKALAEYAITLHLYLWPALALAVQHEFGGPSSGEKREWLAAQVCTFVLEDKMDADDIEEVLEQVMGDEFETVVEDGSIYDVARRCCAVREEVVVKGEIGIVDVLKKEWAQRGGKEVKVVKAEKEDAESESSDDDDDDEDQMDVDSEEKAPKEKVKTEPEIDEDGFTTVVSRKKR
jgi:pre-rRNA-processing protein TSR2